MPQDGKTKLYIGNLPYTDVTEDALKKRFEDFGEVSFIRLITDRETGDFRGFAFIEMDTADANNAMSNLDGSDFEGRPMRVNVAKPRENDRR